jgi:hypothetical protein
MQKQMILFLALLFSVWQSSHAVLGLKPDGHLDMTFLRKAYMESEFEKVRITLERFIKTHPKDATREEKIFTHMYLGVICAADSNSELKAESHFNTLLRLSPHIEPIDMFVPQKIQNLFDRIKLDYLKREAYESKYDAFGNPITPENRDSLGQQEPKPKNSKEKNTEVKSSHGHAWIWWTAGSAALVTTGVGLYALSSSSAKPTPKRINADGTLK